MIKVEEQYHRIIGYTKASAPYVRYLKDVKELVSQCIITDG